MNAETKIDDTAALDRRTLMKMGTVGTAVAIAGVGATVVAASPAEARGGKSINLWVVADFGTFQNSGVGQNGSDGPFYIGGDIFPRARGDVEPLPGIGDEDKIGRFECWGHIHPGGGVVNQEFRLDNRGKIIIAGVEGTAPRAVTGGTDDFARARGQGMPSGGPGEDANLPGDVFTIDFSLTGAQGPPIV